MVHTLVHLFPAFNAWLDDFPDTRDPNRIIYHKRFLLWTALMLFLGKLGSRRQIDFYFREPDTCVLGNLNRLARTRQTSVPINQTVDNYLAGIGCSPLTQLRRQMIYRLIRQRSLEGERLQRHYLILIDGTGYLVFRHRHCEHCLTRQCGETTLYRHQVLEAKLIGPGGMVLSIASEFIDNRDVAPTADTSEEKRKQDCELKALRRLAGKLRQDFPQLPICLSGDSLNACGEGFQIAKDYHLSFIHVFKPGRMPALWKEFQTLLAACPDQKVEVQTPQGAKQEYRWVKDLDYQDSDKRDWKFNAVACEETKADGTVSRWAWLTWLEVSAKTVVEVGTVGGRYRWWIENQGFNVQKNSELNLEHAYSEGEHWAVYYYLVQLAHLLLQLVEKGNLLAGLAQAQGKSSAVALFGSLKNMARKLVESLRQRDWPDEVFIRKRIQIRFDTG